MANNTLNAYHIEHPAPHGGEVGRAALFAGVLGAPLAWSFELLVNYAFASHACFPREQPLPTVIPGWGWVWPTALAINLLTLAVACGATYLSYRNWRRTREEGAGGHRRLLDAGEGRTRFLAVWGIWAGVWFALAIAFNTIAMIEVPLCGR